MVAELRIEGADKFGKLAKALRQAGDKELRKELYRGINQAVKPLTEAVKKGTASYFPRRYAVELTRTLKVTARRRGGRDPSIRLQGKAKTKQGKERNLAALNRGRLRHPLYGDRRHWFNQEVSQGFWDEPLLEGADQVREDVVNVLDEIGKRLEKKL